MWMIDDRIFNFYGEYVEYLWLVEEFIFDGIGFLMYDEVIINYGY